MINNSNMFKNGVGLIPYFNEEDCMFYVVDIDGNILYSHDYVDECYDYIDMLTADVK